MTQDRDRMSLAQPPRIEDRADDWTAEPVCDPTPSDDGALHAKARAAIQAGKLPSRHPEQTWGGPGEGDCCTICGARVRPDEVELEIEFAAAGNGSEADTHHLHPRCFAAWKHELQLAARALSGTTGDEKMPGRASEATSERESA